MTILSARYCAPDMSVAVASTDIAGEVLVPLSGEDCSGGWQPLLWDYRDTHTIAPYNVDP
jgi:hypothetical protein